MNQAKAQCFFCTPYNQQVHSKIESEILRNEFNEGSTWGFRVLTRRQHYLQAVYIEKKTFIEKIIDPFGNTSEFERVAYNQMDFQLSITPPQILIFQPPRNYRKLINQLAQCVDYTIAIENRNVKLFDWVKMLINQGIEGVITKADIDPIIYDKFTTGKLNLSGNNSLREKIVQLLSGTTYIIKNLKIVFSDKLNHPDVELFSNGKVSFSHPVDTDCFKIFYDTFCMLTENVEQSHSPDGEKRGGTDAGS